MVTVWSYLAEIGAAAHGCVARRLGGVEFGAVRRVATLAWQALDPNEVTPRVHYCGGFLRRAAEGYVDEVFAVPGRNWRLE